MTVDLQRLRDAGIVSALDVHLARTLTELADERDPRVLLAAALVSRHVNEGHVCLPLAELASGELALGEHALQWPAPEAWLDALRASPLCGDPASARTPLVLDEHARLYLRRHFTHERALAAALKQRATRELAGDPERLRARLAHYFGAEPDDLQRTAAELACRRALCVISGGPGTGKTSTVVKILALAIEEALAQGLPAPRIALTAPTGKAAVRLESAVQGAKQHLACSGEVRAAIPDGATTIHRALRSRERRDKLALELLVVDEASMVDLELMTELMAALPDDARLILLGDRDQLASVEAGAVLGDICGLGRAPVQASPLAACVIQLTRSYRYDAGGGIGLLARAVQAGDLERALAVLDDPARPEVALCEADPLRDPEHRFNERVVSGFRAYLEAGGAATALRELERFRVLCAHRQGERGVTAMNQHVARLLFAAGLVPASEGNYLGRPLLVTENDYRVRLWNGDVGLVTRAARGGVCAYFPAADGGGRELGLGRLPPHESAFALSVHKSQGSELDEVALILPAAPSRVLSRELLYTAITRARQRVVIHGSRAVFAAALSRTVSRSTGLRDLLY
jgi:exodeoxyribonuclease V alpha subunit